MPGKLADEVTAELRKRGLYGGVLSREFDFQELSGPQISRLHPPLVKYFRLLKKSVKENKRLNKMKYSADTLVHQAKLLECLKKLRIGPDAMEVATGAVKNLVENTKRAAAWKCADIVIAEMFGCSATAVSRCRRAYEAQPPLLRQRV